jgi:hypothetical protein
VTQNMISIQITDDQLAAALKGAAQIEAALPGLISLEPSERRGAAAHGAEDRGVRSRDDPRAGAEPGDRAA